MKKKPPDNSAPADRPQINKSNQKINRQKGALEFDGIAELPEANLFKKRNRREKS